MPVCADQAALPLQRGSVGGIWANKVLQHLPAAALPMALAELHRVLEVGGRLDLLMFSGDGTWTSDDDLPGRRFTLWDPAALADALRGAGFTVDELEHKPPEPAKGSRAAASSSSTSPTWQAGTITVRATRNRTLPDFVGPGMRLLISGLNPSLYAADAGVGFARPGNRFWPALAAAGITDVDRAPRRLLDTYGIGMTDLVKRATVGAAELTRDEYRAGIERIERLCNWLHPAAVCFVGLAGWRAAVDRKATTGWQSTTLGGSPVYVMGNTSGLNARTRLAEFAEHLRAALNPPGHAASASAGSGASPLQLRSIRSEQPGGGT